MKILIDSYNTVTQNPYGGVKLKINEITKRLEKYSQVKLFDKWNDKIDDYDIIHIFSTSIDCWSTVKLAKKKGVRIVVSAIAIPEKGIKLKVKKLISQLFRQMNSYKIQKSIYEAADVIICETEKEKLFIVDSYNVESTKIYVIPNGVCGKREDASENYFRKKTGIDGKFVLQVGRFEPNKNQLSVINAVKGTDIKLVLIGGPDKDFESYYEECKKAAENNVFFLGWVDHDDPLLYSAYKAAQTFIIPSHNEIFGNSMFEAGIYGCNIVATKALPLDSWEFGKYCYSINPCDVRDIKEKIGQSIEREKDDEISRIINENFSWETIIGMHMDIYNNILQ